MVRYLLLILVFGLSACAGKGEKSADLTLERASFSDLPHWGSDNFKGFTRALALSCGRIMKNDPDKAFGSLPEAGRMVDWQGICVDLKAVDERDSGAVRGFVERHFTPYAVAAGQKQEGLFTGYYEASLRGSLLRYGPYQTPLYTRPDDLVMVQLGEFRDDLKGRRIAGRVQDGKLKPYEERSEIVNGEWPHNDKVLVWVDDPVDAFFVQIQGSGIVKMDTGLDMRIGYAGQNGHVYYAIGRELIKRGALEKDNVSLQTIRAWLAANPEQAEEIMNTNRSYVFFQELDGPGPLGGEGVPLTTFRSLAVDRSLLPYGIPLWTAIEAPSPQYPPIHRLMVAQDTGGAIRGPVRGDVFWGHGAKAEEIAGVMKAKGRYWALLPRQISAP